MLEVSSRESAQKKVLEYAEVALPIPLRNVFTYRVPPELVASLNTGMRIAVSFHGRKLAGIVVGLRADPPPGIKRVVTIAGLLDSEPVFPDELFSFMCDAARYYYHPLGEVLRAGCPALPRDALNRLQASGFLSKAETIPGRRVSKRTVRWVRRTTQPIEKLKLGNRQRGVLEALALDREVRESTLRTVVPDPRSVVRRLAKLGLVQVFERDPWFVPVDQLQGDVVSAPALNPAQSHALERLMSAEGPKSFLLHGVTGSGKTEVYLRFIHTIVEQGRGALVLVPEIALTPQLVSRFRHRFGDRIAVVHSALTESERDQAWRSLRSGSVRIAIGVRSALFAPIHNLGVIIVDEEHDPSFKQDDGFRYHARDMALLRAKRAQAVCILGSATPSIETYELARSGRIELLEMPDRATDHALPSVEIVDLRRHRAGPTGHRLLSGRLHQRLSECLAAKEQAILFLNRRGFAPSVLCEECGHVPGCPACSVALTAHQGGSRLVCHYCDHTTRLPRRCSQCGAAPLNPLGLGTEQLAEGLARAFPDARVGRLDRDTAVSEGVEQVLQRMRSRELDILVGTQMVTKGHDLPGVTLVGVVQADQGIHFPDFRASERTFQQLAQVAGRAGRGTLSGRVVFQTFQPEHFAVRAAALHDYLGFFQREVEMRRELGYPPSSRLAAVWVDAGAEDVARRVIEKLARVARRHTQTSGAGVQLLGPAAAPIARVRGRYRFRMLLRSPSRQELRAVVHSIVHAIDGGISPARAVVDIDPVSML